MSERIGAKNFFFFFPNSSTVSEQENNELGFDMVISDLYPSAVKAILGRGEEFQEEQFERGNMFLQSYMEFLIQNIEYDCVSALDALSNIFDGQTDFYLMSESADLSSDGVDGRWADRDSGVQDVPLYLINVNAFGDFGGFDALFGRLEDFGKSRPGLEVVHWVAHILQKLFLVLRPEVKQSFGPRFRESICKMLDSCTEEQLQREEKKSISGILSQLEAGLKFSVGPSYRQGFEMFKLNLGRRLLRLGLLDKRLLGLGLVKEVLDGARALARRQYSDPPVDQWISTVDLAQWIVQDKMLEYLYSEGVHAELLSRCADVAALLAETNLLTEEHIDIIWKASIGQHESIVTEVYKAIPVIASNMCQPGLLHYMYAKMEGVTCGAYDARFLSLVQNFTHAAAARLDMLKDVSGPRSWFGLELLWRFVLDGSGAANKELEGTAQDYLGEFFRYATFQSQRPVFMERCIKCIESGQSVPQAQSLLLFIIFTYPPGTEENQISFVIAWLQKRYGLLELIVQDMARYQALALNKAKDVDRSAHDVNLLVFRGTRPHHVNVTQRRNLLASVLVRAPIQLTQTQLDLCWECLITGAVSEWERSETLSWWRDSFNTPAEDAPYPLFNDEATQFMFAKFQSMQAETLSSVGFSCFRAFFDRVNANAGFLLSLGEGRYLVRNADLLGLSTLWRFAVGAKLDDVARDAASLLVLLQKNLDNSMRSQVGAFRHAFVDQCLNNLQTSLAAIDFGRVDRCVKLLHTFLSELKGRTIDPNAEPFRVKIAIVSQQRPFEVEVLPHTTIAELTEKVAKELDDLDPKMLRVIFAGQELKFEGDTVTECKIVPGATVHFIVRQEGRGSKKPAAAGGPSLRAAPVLTDPELAPSAILSSDKYVEQLFSLLEVNEYVGELVWGLLVKLPANGAISTRIITLDQGNPKWNELFSPTSTYKLLYALRVVDTLLSLPESSQAWLKAFRSTGGLQHLGQIFVTKDFLSKETGPQGVACLALLLKIGVFYCITQGAQPSSGVVLSEFCKQFLAPLELERRVKEVLRGLVARASSPDVTSIAQLATQLLTATVSSSVDVGNDFFGQDFQDWLRSVMLSCENPSVRLHVGDALHEIASKNAAGPRLLQYLLVLIDESEKFLATCSHFFTLCDKMIGVAVQENAAVFENLASGLCVRVLNRHTIETRQVTSTVNKNRNAVVSKAEDFVLQGYLKILSTILSKNKPLASVLGVEPPQGKGLLQYLFKECLFETPTLEDHGPLAPPKCKRKATRSAALGLLVVLASSDPALFKTLTDLVVEHHVLGENRLSWQYLPSAFEKDACGYVGLKNLGATCYMNSFTQNLYMHPEFRKDVFACDALCNGAPAEVEKNVLHQLQSFFGHLQESEMKFYDTRPFVESYPLNPGLQQDVDEFMNLLFDKLDALVKGTTSQNLPGKHFGGSVMNQIISQECPHLSEREEPFMALSVEVKGKRNLAEAMLGYIQGDLLSGDNKYECSQCNKKVDAVKRVCLNKMPDTLVVSLKRFAFNYETFVREKVNSHFDFPHEIDFWDYCRRGLAEKEGKQLADDAGVAGVADNKDYYKYRLAGIIVHTGTTDMGHYYSFVRERTPLVPGAPLRWISFNDSSVEEYDAAQIPADCFGGFSDVVRVDPKTNQPMPPEEKMFSAYMLFYERVSVQHDNAYALTAQNNVPRKILEQVWSSNAAFAADRGIFSEDYFSFCWNLVRLQQNAEVVGDGPLKDYDPVFQAIRLGTKFLFETLCHAKQKFHLQLWMLELTEMYKKHIPACRWLLRRITKNQTWIRSLFLSCTSKSVRELMADLIVSVMEFISALPTEAADYLAQGGDDASLVAVDISASCGVFQANLNPSCGVVPRFIDSLFPLLDEARSSWKNFGELWKLFEGFLRIGNRERKFFAARRGVLVILDCYLGDSSPFKKLYTGKEARKRWQAKSAKPDLAHLLGAIALFVCNSRTLHPASKDMELDELDNATLAFFNGQVFWKWALSDGTGADALGQMAVWLCHGNLERSGNLIEWAVQVINDSDAAEMEPVSKVLLDVLKIQDDLVEERAARFVGPFLRMVEGNAKYRTFSTKCVEFLVQASLAVPAVREELFRLRARWVKRYLVVYDHRPCRVEAEKLFKTLTGEGLEGGVNKEEFALAEESQDGWMKQRVMDLFDSLWELIPDLHESLKVDKKAINQTDVKLYLDMWVLTGLFRCMTWCVRGMAQVERFVQNFEAFRAMYFALEATRNEADLNRKEMVRFWHKCFGTRTSEGTYVAFPFAVKDLMLKDESLCLRFIDFFVSLRSTTRYIEYNNTSLVPFYEMLLVLLEEPAFCTLMANHRNYDWSVQYLWLETTAYPNIAPLIKSVCKLLCGSGSAYRQRHLQWIVTLPLMEQHWARVLFFLDWLVVDQADAVVFCRAGGLEYLGKFFSMLPGLQQQQKPGLTGAKIEPFVGRALRVFQRSIKWMNAELDGHAKEMRVAALEQWDSKVDTVQKLLLAGVMFQMPQITSNCYGCLQVMAMVDSACRHALLQCLSDFHALFREQGVARLPHHIAMASPHQAEHTLNLNKLHEYYNMAKEVAAKSVEEDGKLPWDQVALNTCNVCMMIAMECPLTLGHLCDSFMGLVCQLMDRSDSKVTESRLFVPMFRHLLSELAAPKLTSSHTLTFARNGIRAFSEKIAAEELASLTGWCSGMIVSWLSSAEAGATSVAVALVLVCLKAPAFTEPLLANPVIFERLEKCDPALKPVENRATWNMLAQEVAALKKSKQ